jgi:hypothetical protein
VLHFAGRRRYISSMLDFATIAKIAAKTARSKVIDAGFERAMVAPAIDSDGNDALRITLVLKPEAVKALSGDDAIGLLVEFRRELDRQHEQRFPILEYATEAELLEDLDDGEPLQDDGPESDGGDDMDNAP